jgi:ATP-dependent Lhr-like helicase
MFFRGIADRITTEIADATDGDVASSIWDLVWSGWLTNDTLAPIRSRLTGGGRVPQTRRGRPPRARYGRYAGLPAPGSGATRPAPFAMAGRWSATPARESEPIERVSAAATLLLDRYGVVTRGCLTAERIEGGFATVYPLYKINEESGRIRRGYFVDGLGAAQFALPGAVDRLRAHARPDDLRDSSPALVLSANDPANPYGAAIAWPLAPAPEPGRRGHQPARKAGALVVLVDGRCVIYVERGGRTLLSFSDDPEVLQPAADALALAVRDGALGRLQVERADGAPVVSSPLGAALEAAGFRPTPRGLRLRG